MAGNNGSIQSRAADPNIGELQAPGMCKWWANCSNPATHERRAGPIGMVPICDRCEEILQRVAPND